MEFETVSVSDLNNADLDSLSFGAIRMNRAGVVMHYNTAETQISGLSKERVEGREFFPEVGVCMHNFMVGHKFDEPGDLNEMVDYVLTVRMDPTPVTLRLLKAEDSDFSYLLVKPK